LYAKVVCAANVNQRKKKMAAEDFEFDFTEEMAIELLRGKEEENGS